MASIKKRGNTYQITVSNGFDSDGKRLFEYATFKPDENRTVKQQEKDLNDFAYEFEKKVKEGKVLRGEKLLLNEFAQKWLEEYVKTHLELTTYHMYKELIASFIHPALGHIKLANVTPLHLQSFYNNLLEEGVRRDGKAGGYSPATIRKCHAILSSMFSSALKWQLIENNPCTRISPPKIQESNCVKNFNEEQLSIFISILENGIPVKHDEKYRKNKNGSVTKVSEYTEHRKIQPQLRLFYYLSMFTGCRRGELLGLTWNDIDFAKSVISIKKELVCDNKQLIVKQPKTKSSIRDLKAPSFILDMLKQYKKDQLIYRVNIGDRWNGSNNTEENFIFIQDNGKPMHPSTPYHTFKRIIRNYNKAVDDEEIKLPDITLHGLRHTHATLLIADNMDIRTVSARLGHAKTSTTMNIYAHSLKKLDEQIANNLDERYKNMINIKYKV